MLNLKIYRYKKSADNGILINKIHATIFISLLVANANIAQKSIHNTDSNKIDRKRLCSAIVNESVF